MGLITNIMLIICGVLLFLIIAINMIKEGWRTKNDLLLGVGISILVIMIAVSADYMLGY